MAACAPIIRTPSRLFACIVVVSIAGFAAFAKGANEPWASKSDPTDVPKSHVQEVTTAPFTYNIMQGGTIDGKMCTSLPGVWEPFEQTWESNRSIRMENVGSANVIHPWLTIGPIDFFSQQTIANSVTKGLTTDREKALAIFYFYVTHRFHKACGGTSGAQGDATQAMNIFGFNTCGDSTLCIADLVGKAGVPDCAFSHHPGHCVPQVFFDGKYNTLDGDMATFMLLRDNRTLANEVDLVRDHDLIKRVHQYGILGPSNRLLNEDYAACYTWEGDTIWKIKGWAHQHMGMILRPHEAMEWRWGHEKPVKYHGDVSGHPPFAPDSVCNGLWEYAPDFRNDAQWRAGATVTDIVNQDGVLTAKDGGTGTILWTMKSPYAFIGGALAVTGQGYAFEVGFTDAKDWRKKNFTPLATPAEFDGQFQGRAAMAVEYWLKCTLKGDASLSAIHIKNDIQTAPLAMPSMTVGDNRFTYLEHPSSSGSSNARNLKITHHWMETSRTRPPGASEAAVYPADGSQTDGTDVVFQWKPAADPDGDAITDYHFQLSDRSDMRWPLSPNFEKYISRTPDKGKAQYTLPRPGLLTPGVLYYWHVKAKDAKGVWGPWSATWSFTAEGPAYPVNVALKFNAGAGIGTLTWSANPLGRAPAKYRVYGSDEKGFTVQDEPYEVRLGMTKELINPFPANFVAEVAGTSLDVVGVGNSLPNANKAYYRMVAVDEKGKRSGDSDYIEAPRPFIFSTPVTAAPAGQPYSYQVKAIRSIGDLTSRLEAKPKPGPNFWKIEALTFALTQKPAWMSIDAKTGLITGTPDGTGGTVIVSVTLAKEHRLVHDNEGGGICWGNEWGKSRTYETLGPVTQQFVVRDEKE